MPLYAGKIEGRPMKDFLLQLFDMKGQLRGCPILRKIPDQLPDRAAVPVGQVPRFLFSAVKEHRMLPLPDQNAQRLSHIRTVTSPSFTPKVWNPYSGIAA